MEYWKEVLGVVGIVLVIVGQIPYVINVLKKKTTPHFYTWLIWSITTIIIFLGQVTAGAGAGAWITGVNGAMTIFITLLSLKYGTKDVRAVDTFFLCLALLGIVLWMLTSDPLYSVVLSSIIGVVAYFPTIRKSWKDPQSETASLYGISFVRHILSLFALSSYNITTIIYPLSAGIMNAITLAVVSRKRSTQ
jgi:uncharacterized protein with PQ loop repeat